MKNVKTDMLYFSNILCYTSVEKAYFSKNKVGGNNEKNTNRTVSSFTVTAYFAKLNLLWLFFTLLGLGIFGFGPATAVTIKCLHDFRKTGHDYSAVAFWQAYKQAFRTFSLLALDY